MLGNCTFPLPLCLPARDGWQPGPTLNVKVVCATQMGGRCNSNRMVFLALATTRGWGANAIHSSNHPMVFPASKHYLALQCGRR